MSVRLEVTNDEALTRASFITYSDLASYTVAGYLYLHSLPATGNHATIFSLHQDGNFAGLGLRIDDAGHLYIRNHSGGNDGPDSAAVLSAGQWYYVWVRFVATGSGFHDYFVYLDESTTATVADITVGLANVAGSFSIGQSPAFDTVGTTETADASFFNWKFWSSDVAASQATAEAAQAAFVNAGLARWLFSDFTDIDDDEGALDLTAVGTHSEGPTNPWGGTSSAQEGFRFRNDNGSETTATWAAAQDANITAPLTTNLRLRLLLDTTGDTPSRQVRLDYKKSTDSEYIPVLMSQPAEVPPEKVASVAHTSPANPTTTFSITIPTVQIDDLLIVEFISRDHTSGTAQPTVTDDDGGTWIQKGFSTTRKLQVWYRRATAATSAKVITVAGCVGSCTGMLRVLRGVLLTGDPITDLVFEVNASGNEAHAGFTPANANSLIVFGVGNATNDTILVTLLAAATLGTFEPEDVQDDSTGGLDCYLITSARPSPGGPTNTGGFTWAQTNSATESYSYAVRPSVIVAHPILLSPSANIAAAAATSTTPQLTPPATKSTSDHEALRISDDTNPLPAIDLGLGKYGEAEFCLTAVSGVAVDGDIYQFRATINGTPLDSYLVTPQWTIGVGAIDFAVSLAAAASLSAALTAQIEMLAALTGSAVVAAPLTTEIRMAVLLQASATLAPLLSTDIQMAVVALASGMVSPALATDIQMATALLASADLVAPLSAVPVDFFASLSASAEIAPALATDITLATSLTAVAATVVALATEIQMAAQLLGSGNVVAAIVTDILMSTSLSGSATLAPDLSAQATGDIAASLNASAAISPDLATDVQMSASMIASAVIAAGLTTDVRLAAALDAIATMSPTLVTDVQLAVSLLGSATLAPDLEAAIEFATALTASAAMQGELATDILLAATLLATATLNVPTIGSPAADFAAALTAEATLTASLSDLPVGVGALAAILSVMPDFSAALKVLPDLAAAVKVQPDQAGKLTSP